jgi:hypothetical protein
VVVEYLKSKYGYTVTMMIPHSKAVNMAMRYLCTHEDVAAGIRCFVNVAGRYRMVRPIKMPFGAHNLRSLCFFHPPENGWRVLLCSPLP